MSNKSFASFFSMGGTIAWSGDTPAAVKDRFKSAHPDEKDDLDILIAHSPAGSFVEIDGCIVSRTS